MHVMNVLKGEAQIGIMPRAGMCEGRADEWRKGQQQQMEIMLKFEDGNT